MNTIQKTIVQRVMDRGYLSLPVYQEIAKNLVKLTEETCEAVMTWWTGNSAESGRFEDLVELLRAKAASLFREGDLSMARPVGGDDHAGDILKEMVDVHVVLCCLSWLVEQRLGVEVNLDALALQKADKDIVRGVSK